MLNKYLTNEFTSLLQKLVVEVVNDPKTYKGSALLPAVALPAQTIRMDVVEASGGVTQEHNPDTATKYIRSFGTRVLEFSPAYYKEAIHYNEKKLLYLRDLGNRDTSVRGVQKYIELDMDRLNRRIEARMELERWSALFNGGFTWMGKTVSYGIPSANRAVPIGAKWSLDGINANPLANPVKDIRYWLDSYAPFGKYVVTKMWMNSTTARFILDNANTQTFLTSYGANPKIDGYTVQKALSFLIPGCPEVEVYKSWYQTESVVNNKIVVSDRIFFIPDGKILFEVGNLPSGDKYGEFVQGCHLASGTIEQPGYGKFLVVDDCTGPGSKGGPTNPFIDFVGGVYGQVKLDRYFDVLTADVL